MPSTDAAENQNTSANSETNSTDNTDAVIKKHIDLVCEFSKKLFHFSIGIAL